MPETSESIERDELDGLFARLFADRPQMRCALAVSGGSDSTALMVLLAEWIAQRTGQGTEQAGRSLDAFTVLTVDHRLRPESAAEAQAVARQACALGLRHAVLVWEGDKPNTGLQAAARAARYRLMADYARAHDIGLILMAHTEDDQAETLLMRLARGSGLDGLGAMAPIAPLQDGESLLIARPLLCVPKTRLQASLRRRGIGWIEDPSNASPVFERVRLRAARVALESLGLTPGMLSLSARRLRQARSALDRWVADVLDPVAGMVEVHACGFFKIDRSRLGALPDEIIARVLTRAIAAAGGSGEPVPLAGVEAILADLSSSDSGMQSAAWTLARARLAATPKALLIEREPGRDALPVLVLAPGQAAIWDGRFRVSAGPSIDHPVQVRALGVDGVRELRSRIDVPAGLPVGSLRAVASFWRGEQLLAVPPLGFRASADLGDLAAAFLPLASPWGARR
jgi:tRNA(Ile)-lysidine synthase